MSMQDPIADMLTCIRNAQRAGIKNVTVAFSNVKKQILAVLKDEGFIENFEAKTVEKKRYLDINLKYYQGRPVIDKIDRVSRPALRIYKGYDSLPQVKGGLGVVIVSTPKGVMADKHARANKVGGEVICTVQ